MAYYTYSCKECEDVFENVVQSVYDDVFETHDQIPGHEDDECTGPIKRHLGSIMRMDFRGKGFHCNDYPKSRWTSSGKPRNTPQ